MSFTWEFSTPNYLKAESEEEIPSVKRCWKPLTHLWKDSGYYWYRAGCALTRNCPGGPLMLTFQCMYRQYSALQGIPGWKVLKAFGKYSLLARKGGGAFSRVWNAWTHKGYHINRKDKACVCYIPISEVEAVGRAVVAWRWSIVHLIRHIWPGRALLEERQQGNFHKDGNKGSDSPLIPHSCCCHATNFSSSLLLGGGDGPWIFYTALQAGCQGARLIPVVHSTFLSLISQSLSPDNTGPKCAQL